MAEIMLCDIVNATMRLKEDGSMHASIVLPKVASTYYEHRHPSGEWVLQVYRRFLEKGSAQFANDQNPTRPVSGGTVDVVGGYEGGDYHILLTRKPIDAPTHPGYHSLNSGFPMDKSEWRNPSLVVSREGGEERFYYTKDGFLLVPPDPKGTDATIEAALRTGVLESEDSSKIDNSKITYLDGPDTLEVLNHRGDSLYHESGYFAWSADSGPNFIKSRHVDTTIHEVIPYDGEGMLEDGRFVPFNREVFVFSRQDLEGLAFGDELKVNRDGTEQTIYVWETKHGVRQIQREKPKELDDIYKADPVTQKVLSSMGIRRKFRDEELDNLIRFGFPTDFSPIANEVSQIIKSAGTL